MNKSQAYMVTLMGKYISVGMTLYTLIIPLEVEKGIEEINSYVPFSISCMQAQWESEVNPPEALYKVEIK